MDSPDDSRAHAGGIPSRSSDGTEVRRPSPRGSRAEQIRAWSNWFGMRRLIGMAGLAIDYTRASSVRAEMQNAADSAALAAASRLPDKKALRAAKQAGRMGSGSGRRLV